MMMFIKSTSLAPVYGSFATDSFGLLLILVESLRMAHGGSFRLAISIRHLIGRTIEATLRFHGKSELFQFPSDSSHFWRWSWHNDRKIETLETWTVWWNRYHLQWWRLKHFIGGIAPKRTRFNWLDYFHSDSPNILLKHFHMIAVEIVVEWDVGMI